MKVSVVMAVYNGERFVRSAIDSILSQTFTDFEFLIVNDGSTDGTADILKSITDPRVKVFHQDNQGCILATEKAVGEAKGEYIAIIDADDIALPERLEKTVTYLDSHPDTVLVGTGFINSNEDLGVKHIEIPPSNDTELRQALLKYDPFKHPTLLMRADALRNAGSYKGCPYSDHGHDYELYSRLAKFGKLANIPEPLAIIRQHQNQFFRAGHSAEEHRRRVLNIRWRTLFRLRPRFPLFIKTMTWLLFEQIVHMIPESIRHMLPSAMRNYFKASLPPKTESIKILEHDNTGNHTGDHHV